jgi:hypothetical protein
MADVASSAGGEYGGMVPVSGAAALAPQQQIAEGQNLANYLAQNQLVSAQTQGGMAELAQLLGPAYANQYALMDAQARAQAEAQKAAKTSELQNRLALERADALAQLELGGLEDRRAEEAQRRQLEKAYRLLATPENMRAYATAYAGLNDQDKAYLANTFGVTSAEEYAQFQIEQQANLSGLTE